MSTQSGGSVSMSTGGSNWVSGEAKATRKVFRSLVEWNNLQLDRDQSPEDLCRIVFGFVYRRTSSITRKLDGFLCFVEPIVQEFSS